MANYVKIEYYVTFGSGDASDTIEDEIMLTDEEYAVYQKALEEEESFEDYPELQAVLDRVYDEIKETEEENFLSYDDEYTMECLGLNEVDPDEINDLVADRDEHTLQYFNLLDLSEDELDEWDANELETLPQIKDFDPDFEPESPFESGWDLVVSFAEDEF